MTYSTITQTHWYPDKKLIATHISGEVDVADIQTWEQSLKQALTQVEENSTFKIFVNLYGFKAVNIEAHKKFRSIIPSTLANYGWRVGYLDLFEEAAGLSLTNTRGIACVAAAHAHQDASKIEAYEMRFGKTTEHFFTDPAKAEEWILKFPVSN